MCTSPETELGDRELVGICQLSALIRRKEAVVSGCGRPGEPHRHGSCTFWQVEALAAIGRIDEARTVLDRVGSIRSPLGLLAEDVDPATGTMWGNFAQACSHVGVIHAAFAASPAVVRLRSIVTRPRRLGMPPVRTFGRSARTAGLPARADADVAVVARCVADPRRRVEVHALVARA